MTEHDEEPVKILPCPTCQRSVSWSPDNPHRPFCSERCRMIDLGAWADGSRYIPGDSDYDPPDGDPPEL